MQIEKLRYKLRQIILENAGDRDDIESEVFDLIKPMILGLIKIAEPKADWHQNPLLRKQNIIEYCRNIADELLQYPVEGFTDDSKIHR